MLMFCMVYLAEADVVLEATVSLPLFCPHTKGGGHALGGPLWSHGVLVLGEDFHCVVLRSVSTSTGLPPSRTR